MPKAWFIVDKQSIHSYERKPFLPFTDSTVNQCLGRAQHIPIDLVTKVAF